MNRFKKSICLLLLGLSFATAPAWAANLYLNVLAVNGTEEQKKKEIRAVLPRELSAEDILDTDGLRLDYDVEESAYIVSGEVTLGAKETKTFKILIRDLWQFDEIQISKIKEQIDASFDQLEGTPFVDSGKIKRQTLLQRLDFLLQEQARFADNIDKRIDNFRTYSPELVAVRENASSIKYWRTKPPPLDEASIFYFIIEVENPTDQTLVSDKKHYLPREVKPENFVDLQDFEIRYDATKQRSYLLKEEELKAHEQRRYNLGVIDIWNIKQAEMDGLKERARVAYKFIEPTKYVDNANFLMENIKGNLEAIQDSQLREKSINEHISIYRRNLKRFEEARKDVETLDELLEVIREELKRSKVENVLKKVRGLSTLADIAKSLLKKPADKVAWNIIIMILGFVGLLTSVNYIVWQLRSKGEKSVEPQEESGKGN